MDIGVSSEQIQSQLKLLRRLGDKRPQPVAVTMPQAAPHPVAAGPTMAVSLAAPPRILRTPPPAAVPGPPVTSGAPGVVYKAEQHVHRIKAESEPTTPLQPQPFGGAPPRSKELQRYPTDPPQECRSPGSRRSVLTAANPAPPPASRHQVVRAGRHAGSPSPSPIRTAGALALDASPGLHLRDTPPRRMSRGEASAPASRNNSPPQRPGHPPRCRTLQFGGQQGRQRRQSPDLVEEREAPWSGAWEDHGRVGTSTTTAGSTSADMSVMGSMPSSPRSEHTASASSHGQRALARREEGAHYLSHSELPPFATPPEDRFVNDVLGRLGSSDDWAEQFKAIDDARRLARHAPRLLAGGGHLKKLMTKVAALMESLRSALAKNALRCTGEFFLVFGRKLDPEIETCVAVILRRAADTNAFIAEEAEGALREVCKAASEARLLTQLLSALGHRRAEIRARSAWGLAMLAQRHLRARAPAKGLDMRAIEGAAVKTVTDASADVRLCGRFIASVLVGGNAVEDGAAKAKLQASVFQGTDPASFDAFDLEAIRRSCGSTGDSLGGGGCGRRRGNQTEKAY
mmetsp:Transcript_107718/g.332827  ORF Transcript_107718/g.332827 Transcript_107718/m.332827 type:complete len:572 (+) Transcript_107718:99-1814(+)